MAIVNGAKVLMWENEIGSIEPGKKADLVVVDLSRPHTTPVNDPSTTLLYSSYGGDVLTTIVDGKLLMENRRLAYKNYEEVLEKAIEKTEEIMEKIRASWKK